MSGAEEPELAGSDPEDDLLAGVEPAWSDAEIYDDLIYDDEGKAHIEFELEVGTAADGYRLDRFLSIRFTRMSRTRVHKMLAAGGVRCRSSGEVLRKNAQRVRAGQVLVIRRPAPEEPPVMLDYAVLHHDPHLLVLDKPANLPVHPSARYHRHTLTALMRRRLGPGHGWEMAHRLDRETSGVMVFGRRKSSGPALKGSFYRREVDKEYLALVAGRFEGTTLIDIPLGPALGSEILIKVGRRELDDGGLPAQTEVEALAHGEFRAQPITLVRCRPRTGRTHQIRVHMAAIGHPLLGDKLYAVSEQEFLDVVENGRPVAELEAKLGLARHALHARSLSLPHPHSGERIRFVAAWPAELAAILGLPDGC
ncbi:MAG TPA: RluA family pseudouridine synthase [Enhygromyxa sp.]|nr:RluA family pseudouridine synthase [Enhygromyxa sp.]